MAYIQTTYQSADGPIEMSVYNGYALNPDKPYIFEVWEMEDNELVTRECYTHLDLALNEYMRVLGIEVANIIQDHRK